MADPPSDIDPDVEELKAHAEAHREQLRGPLFQKGLTTQEAFAGVTVQTLNTSAQGRASNPVSADAFGPLVQPATGLPPQGSPASRELQNDTQSAVFLALSQIQTEISEIKRRFTGEISKNVAPAWLRTAGGNPHTYDAPNAARAPAGIRVLPTLQAQVAQVQQRRGLRTLVGAWEFLVRLGLAAEEHLPRDGR